MDQEWPWMGLDLQSGCFPALISTAPQRESPSVAPGYSSSLEGRQHPAPMVSSPPPGLACSTQGLLLILSWFHGCCLTCSVPKDGRVPQENWLHVGSLETPGPQSWGSSSCAGDVPPQENLLVDQEQPQDAATSHAKLGQPKMCHLRGWRW